MSKRSRYEGKNLLYLLLSFGIPILLLYFSLAVSITATETRAGQQHRLAFERTSQAIAVSFYAAQLFCARYLQRAFLPNSGSKVVEGLRYVAVLVGALFCSVCGAVACEAFGYDLFLRVMGERR